MAQSLFSSMSSLIPPADSPGDPNALYGFWYPALRSAQVRGPSAVAGSSPVMSG